MDHITNYLPHWCMMDGIMDKDWGCGWRSLQTLLSQLNIYQDVFTIAFDVKLYTDDPELIIDYDKPEISMSDISQLAPYYVSVANSNGSTSANFDMFMVDTLASIDKSSEILNAYFNESHHKNLVMIGTGGNVSLVGGFKREGESNMIYLIDPHVDNEYDNFGDCKGIGRGGQGWVDLKSTVLYGKELLGKSESDFLAFSPAILVTFTNVKLEE